MSGWINFLAEQFRSNQILQAAVLASPAAALMFIARNLPFRIWRAIVAACTIEVTFHSDSGDYHAIVAFISERMVSERWSRRLSYHASSEWDPDSGKQVARHEGLRAGEGRHWGLYRRHPVIVDRHMLEASATDKFKEKLTVSFVTHSRAVVRRFVSDLMAHVAQGGDEEMVPLFLSESGWWSTGPKLPLRSLNTVFTSHGEGERLLRHVRAFEAARGEYRARGRPWHTGALLVGPPGTGKTSLIHAVASETRRSIRYLSLGAVENDQQLVRLIAGAASWRRSLLVIEDADAAGAEVSRDAPPLAAASGAVPGAVTEAPPRKPVTLSALLNALDGLITPDGLIVLATTNHPERLDPALRRPGRFDLLIELGPLEWAAFARMAELFGCGGARLEALEPYYTPETGARLRALLIEGGFEAVDMHMFALAAKAG